MMVKPARALELHYPVIQFLIKGIITCAIAMQICAPVKGKVFNQSEISNPLISTLQECRNQRILT